MFYHRSTFSSWSRMLRMAIRIRDFTVPSGICNSDAISWCVLSSKKAFWMTKSCSLGSVLVVLHDLGAFRIVNVLLSIGFGETVGEERIIRVQFWSPCFS